MRLGGRSQVLCVVIARSEFALAGLILLGRLGGRSNCELGLGQLKIDMYLLGVLNLNSSLLRGKPFDRHSVLEASSLPTATLFLFRLLLLEVMVRVSLLLPYGIFVHLADHFFHERHQPFRLLRLGLLDLLLQLISLVKCYVFLAFF